MLNKIGIENFRVFKDLTEFEFRPLTLLLGPNNSGKSSLVKLLLLLKNGHEDLEYTKGNHNLESYEKSINWNSKKKEISIRLEHDIPILPDSYYLDLIYRDGYVHSMAITKRDSKPLLAATKIRPTSNGLFSNYDGKDQFTFDMKHFIDLIYEKEIIFSEQHTQHEVERELSELNLSNLHEFFISKINEFNGPNLAIKYCNLLSRRAEYRMTAISNEIDNLKKNHLLYNIFIDQINVTKNHEFYLTNDLYKKYIDFECDDGSLNLFSDVKNMLQLLDGYYKGDIKNYIKEKNIGGHLEVKYSKLGKLIFSELFFPKNPGVSFPIEKWRLLQGKDLEKILVSKKDLINRYYSNELSEKKNGTTLFEQLSFFDFWIDNRFKSLQYISANRGSQKRVLLNKGESELDEIVMEYAQIKDFRTTGLILGVDIMGFLKKALSIFDIHGDIEIERFQNYASVINIDISGKKVNLSDLGFGYAQIIPIILKIINLQNARKYEGSNFLIIEEPEANLHPNLQSKIADFLLLILDSFPDNKILIETHSEYLVRKLQYFTANKRLKTDQTIIYYFNSDKNVSRMEPKVKPIEITETGNLTDTFGPGFYDEATRLQFDLMKVNKEQHN